MKNKEKITFRLFISDNNDSELKFEYIIWKDDGVEGMTLLKLNGKEITIKKEKNDTNNWM